jgi:hypothetical protein
MTQCRASQLAYHSLCHFSTLLSDTSILCEPLHPGVKGTAMLQNIRNSGIHHTTTFQSTMDCICNVGPIVIGKAIPLRAWTGSKVSSRMRLPDFKTIST